MTQTMQQPLAEALQWALETAHDPSMAAADWLSRDIDPSYTTAVALLAGPSTPVEHFIQAKNVFKAMRVMGETSGDRQLGSKLYVLAIAGALVRHQRHISRQKSDSLRKALNRLVNDRSMPEPLIQLAGMAICLLQG